MAMASCKPHPLNDISTPLQSLIVSPPPLGCSIIAESSTGCVFAGSALGKKGEDRVPLMATEEHCISCTIIFQGVCVCVPGVYADKIGIEAAEMLLRNIRHNGCVDEFLQDQVRSQVTWLEVE